MQQIRKVSVGVDYKNSMHYIVGQEVMGSYKIDAIVSVDNGVAIWIEKDKEIFCWKQINFSSPMVIEYNINF